ncbi:MAG: MATE family efflux transporter [Flavobacteriaceae bacterium]|nr:MATE family efflux transporter [Flavobacteriaceae bacterium]
MNSITFKNINKLAIPALIAGIAEPLLSTTDLVIIGNIEQHSVESISAVGIVGSFLSMLIWVFGQSRSAISSIIAQYLGANKLDEVKNLPAQAIFIILLASLLILGISYPFATQIFKFYNAEGLILDFSAVYFKIRALGFPFTLLVIVIFGLFRGLQNTMYPMIIALIGTAVNIILDVVLVYGIDGYIPAMKIEGAGYASVIAQIIMFLLSVVLLLKKTSVSLRFSLPFNKEIRIFLSIMANLFIRTLALNFVFYLSTSYATSFGEEYIATYTIGFNLWLIGSFMIDGYSSAGNILSGKLLGSKNYKGLLILGNKLLKYGFVFGLILAFIGTVFYNHIGLLFTKDPKVLEQFHHSFWIILLMQPVCSIAFIYDGMFKGLGYASYLRNVLLFSTILVFVPVFFLTKEYKLYSIWLAFFCWIIARGLPLIVKFRMKFLSLAEKPEA